MQCIVGSFLSLMLWEQRRLGGKGPQEREKERETKREREREREGETRERERHARNEKFDYLSCTLFSDNNSYEKLNSAYSSVNLTLIKQYSHKWYFQ